MHKNYHTKALIVLVAVLGLLIAEPARAEFDSAPWKLSRELTIGPEVPDGPVGIALEAGVLEKCRPDLADLRLVGADGQVVPCTMTDGMANEEPQPFPAHVFRMAKKQGAWTDLWLDLSAKMLTCGVLLQTPTRDFVRRIEVRGSDNAKESYVIRLDGLVADTREPLPLQSLAVMYPVHNFQYLHLRILDQDQPPLKVEGVFCFPPEPENKLARALDPRIMENHGDTVLGTTTVVADLGERRFPITELRISTPTREFAKKVTLFAAPSGSSMSWKKIYEGTFFRLVKEEASEEGLRARFSPCTLRYLKVMLSGSGSLPVVVDRMYAKGTIRLLAFKHHQGRGYRLFYGNPQSASPIPDAGLNSEQVLAAADTSEGLHLGPEQRNVVPPKPAQSAASRTAVPKKSSAGTIAAVLVVLVGLLLLFSVMLKARSWRQARRRPGTGNVKL